MVGSTGEFCAGCKEEVLIAYSCKGRARAGGRLQRKREGPEAALVPDCEVLGPVASFVGADDEPPPGPCGAVGGGGA